MMVLVIILLKMGLDVESLIAKQVTVLLVDQLRQFEKVFLVHQTHLCERPGHNFR